jgi:diacylglycerol O-acyltransferase
VSEVASVEESAAGGSRPPPAPGPGRVLIVSADIGEGHNAVGRALEEAIGKTWPGCEVAWLDSLEVMGPGVAPLARAIYRIQVERTPWLYEFFFRVIWRHRWFLESTRRVIGWWCGRRMAPVIGRLRPDVIVSTYPLGSAGLSWLRQRGRLRVPAGAWVSDFCPHPYWLYRDLDITYVMHPSALPVAESAEPGIRATVCALPVRGDFDPAGRGAARAKLGLDPGQPVVLLSTGSLGFGNVEAAASAILAADPKLLLTVVCGRNERLRARLASGCPPDGRMRVLGWTEDMPAWITAADVLVTNGGGVTALEAVACGRPVIMFQPIAAHGRANAALMASAGLALVCSSPAELTGGVQRQLAGTGQREELARAAASRAAGRSAADDLRELAALPVPEAGSFPLRAADALFLHAQTPAAPQQVGAVVILDRQVSLADICAAVAARAAEVPALRRRLLPAAGRWSRPRWVVDSRLDVASRITVVSLEGEKASESLDDMVGRYFAEPLDVARAPWEMLFVRGYQAGGGSGSRDLVVLKMHHALGDSFALIAALSGLFDQAARAGAAASGQGRRPPAAALARRLARAGPVTAGLWAMISAGRVPPGSPAATVSSPGRRFARCSLPARDVIVTARRMHTSTTDLLLTLVADALSRLMAEQGRDSDRRVRVMVPRTVMPSGSRAVSRPGGRRGLRAAGRDGLAGAGLAGNRTAGVLLDLPLGDMPVSERAAAVHELHGKSLRRGDAEAAAFVLSAVSLLPPPLQRRFARTTYGGAWFSMIVSVFPGLRRACYLLGAQIAEVYPVLALASGTGLAVGAITWGDSLSVGVLADAGLVPDPVLLAGEIRRSFAACTRVASGQAGDGPAGGNSH